MNTSGTSYRMYHLLVLSVFAAVAAQAAYDQTWTGAAGDGCYTNRYNWNQNMKPEDGMKAWFDRVSVTLDATREPMHETSRTWVTGGQGSTPVVFEIDCRGSSWVKGFAVNQAHVDEASSQSSRAGEVFKIMNASGGHLCNIEGVTTDSGKDHLEMTDALFRYTAGLNETTVEFVQGDFNIYDPGRGKTTGQNWTLGYSAGFGPNRFIVRKGANLRANGLNLRGATTDMTELIVEGGNHYIANHVQIKEAAGDGKPARMSVLGGSMDVGGVYLSNRGHDTIRNYGEFILTNDAEMVCRYRFNLASAKNTDAHAFIGGASRLTLKGALNDADGAYGHAVMDVFGDAHVASREVYVARGVQALHEIRLSGNAVWEPETEATSSHRFYIGLTTGSTGLVSIAGNARMTTSGDVYCGHQIGAAGTVDVAGNGLLSSAYSYYVGNSAASYGLLRVRESGTIHATHCLYIAGPDGHAGVTGAVVRVEGGTLHVERGGTLNGVNCSFIQTGGVTDVTSYNGNFSIARGAAATSGARFEISGGEFYATNGAITVGKDDKTATVRLAGGRVRTRLLTGNSTASTLEVDGATLELEGTYRSGDFGTAVLGAGGLLLRNVDANNHPEIAQAFTDAAGAAGTITFDAPAWMKLRTNSSHAKTHVVANGQISVASGVTRFGREFSAEGGAQLYFDDAAGFTCERMTIGDTSGRPVQIQLASGAKISVTEADGFQLVGDTVIQFASEPEPGSFTILETTTPIPAADLGKLHVKVTGGTQNRRYAFSSVSGGIALVVSEAGTASDAVWIGTQGGSWATPGNWQGGAVPEPYANVTFPSVAAAQTVTLAGPTPVGNLALTGTGKYTLAGDGSISDLANVTVTGEHEIAVPISPVSIGTSGVVKDGDGTLVLSGDNRVFSGPWTLAGGVLSLTDAYALGDGSKAAGGLTLKDGTLKYSGTDLAVTRGLQVAQQTANEPVAVNVAAGRTLAIAGSVNLSQGVFVKDGPGEFVLDLAATGGSAYHSFGVTSGDVKANSSTSRAVTETDGVFTSNVGLGGTTVVDGTLRLRAVPGTIAWIYMNYGILLGVNAPNRGPANLIVDGARLYSCGGGLPIEIGGAMPASTDHHATLTALGGAVVANTFTLGRWNGSAEACNYPTFAATNAEIVSSWGFSMPHSAQWTYVRPSFILNGPRATFRFDRSSGTTGVVLGQGVSFEVSDGAQCDFTRVKGANAGKEFFSASAGASYGTVSLLRGGTLTVNAIVHENTATTQGMDMRFDGGRLAFATSATSFGAVGGLNRLTFLVDGGEIAVGEGLVHTLALPCTGEGALTKMGAGTLWLTNTLDYASGAPIKHSDSPAGQCAKTIVAEGALALAPGSVAQTMAIEVRDGACVDLKGGTVATGVFTGGGTVTNGALSACGLAWREGQTAAETPVFTGVALDRVTVDFGKTGDETLPLKTPFPVARFASGTTYDVSRIRGKNAGELVAVTFLVADGVLYGTACHAGMAMIIR